MSVQLTVPAINKAMKAVATEGRRDLSDAGCSGLRLRLTPSGAASWVLACRDREGRMRRFPIGSWPAMGISEARTAARGLHVKVSRTERTRLPIGAAIWRWVQRQRPASAPWPLSWSCTAPSGAMRRRHGERPARGSI